MESRLEDAVLYINENPSSRIYTVAREFGVPYTTLRRRLSGVTASRSRPATNNRLSRPEEAAICRYIDRLERVNLAVRREFVTDAANAILRERLGGSAFTPVGPAWTSRFLRRHRYLVMRQQSLNKDRQAQEDIPRVEGYFKQLQKVVTDEGILPSEIWNMDETGFRIGMGKNQLVVTKRKRSQYLGMSENRESATAVECISADGRYLPAFLILSGQRHMSRWYEATPLDGRTAISLTESGYTNDEISLRWLQHFCKHTDKSRIGSKRLLILDGHGSHHTREFISTCQANNIIPFSLPPHLTHILQPLDVVVFQPLKHYHAKALDLLARDGIPDFTKLDFLTIIEDVRQKAFKKSTIIHTFEKTGIHPFNPQPVLKSLQLRVTTFTPSPPSSTRGLQSSPFNTPLTLRQIDKVADKLEEAIKETEGLAEEAIQTTQRLVRGAKSIAAELIQVKRDLGRTQMAEMARRQRRAKKNAALQSGGTLEVSEARNMVKQRKEDEIAKAKRLVEASEQRIKKQRQKPLYEAAKKARMWRMNGRLGPLSIFEDGRPERFVRRG